MKIVPGSLVRFNHGVSGDVYVHRDRLHGFAAGIEPNVIMLVIAVDKKDAWVVSPRYSGWALLHQLELLT